MIRVSESAGTVRLMLDRPERANAITGAMLQALADAIGQARTARVLVVTGAGNVFSGGADLDEARADLATSPLWAEVSDALAAFPRLTIAALNGPCVGGAMGLALACDLRVAVPRTRLFYPVMRQGFLPFATDVGRLVALVGPARTRLILMGGARIGAEDALAMGLVDRVTDDPGAAVAELSRDVLAARPGYVSAVKAMIDGR